MSYKYILFDFDGTVSDSGEGVMESAAYALSCVGVIVADPMELRSFVGPPLMESFSGFPGVPPERAGYVVEKYREYYTKYAMSKNKLYPGIGRLFRSIRASGRKVVVATSKHQKTTETLLSDLGAASLVDFVAGQDETRGRRDKTSVIKYAFEELPITDKREAVMVGDRKYDIIGANAMGIDSVGVLYGYGDEAELRAAGATYIAETVEDIAPLVLR